MMTWKLHLAHDDDSRNMMTVNGRMIDWQGWQE